MSEDLKTPAEWAVELGHVQVRRQQGQALRGEEVVSVPSSAYAAARALHFWTHDEHHAPAGERLRITRAVFDAALAAAVETVPAVLVKGGPVQHVFAPAPAALGKYTPAAEVERAKALRPSKEAK
jgi:hypothetical protein